MHRQLHLSQTEAGLWRPTRISVEASGVYTLFLPSRRHSAPTQPACAALCRWLPTQHGLQDPWHHSGCWHCRGLRWGDPILNDCTQTDHKSRKNHHHPGHPSERHLYWNVQHFWSQQPCHSSRKQLDSAVGRPAEFEGTRQPDLPCLVHAHQQHQCNSQDGDQGGCRDTTGLVYTFISGRLDYCTSLLYNIWAASFPLNKLQIIQNHAARVVTGTRKYDRIAPVLRELHWLLACQRVIFKLLMLTGQAVRGQASVYTCVSLLSAI